MSFKRIIFTVSATLLAAGCGDGKICPSQSLVAISAPFNGAVLNNSHDTDLGREGVQIDVPVRSNLRPGADVELEVIVSGDDNETVVIAAEVGDDGRATFEGVTVPYGELFLRAMAGGDECGDSSDGIAIEVINSGGGGGGGGDGSISPISGINVTAPARNFINVSWNPPIGVVDSYIIKISETPLTDNNFDVTGTELENPPSVDEASPAVNFSPLRPGVDYYVGIATTDGSGGRSVAVIGGPGQPDFEQTAITGTGAGDEFGKRIAHGDLNGDGQIDAAVAAPGEGDGKVYVYLGGVGGLATTPSATLTGDTGNYFGGGLTALDWNGDAQLDLAVGAPGANSNDGAVYIYFGGSGFTGALGTGDADVVISVDGGSTDLAGGNLGADLASARFDNDTNDDLIIAAPNADGTDGALVVIYGGSTEAAIGLDEDNATPMGTAKGVYFLEPGFIGGGPGGRQWASRIFNLGKLEGTADDTDDIGVAHGEDNADGSAAVIRGRAQPVDAGLTALAYDGGQDLEINYPWTDADDTVEFGMAMAGMSDQNGDGARDIWIGGWRDGDNQGRVFLVDGDEVGTHDTDEVAFVITDITSNAVGGMLGLEILVGGDIDGDQANDLIIAGRDVNSGRLALYMWYSDNLPTGSTTVADADRMYLGPASFPGDEPVNFEDPSTASWIGDVDGDGLADLCWSDWNGDNGGDNDGALLFLR